MNKTAKQVVLISHFDTDTKKGLEMEYQGYLESSGYWEHELVRLKSSNYNSSQYVFQSTTFKRSKRLN